MAFPTVAAVGTPHEVVGNSTTKEVNCPAALTGDRLVLLMVWDANPTVSITDVNSQSWVERIDASSSGAIRFYVYEIVSLTGDISSQTVTITLGGSQAGGAQIIAVRGSHATEAVAASTAATGNSTAPDPGSLNPSGWDVEDTLWFAVCGQDDGRRTVSAYPTDYTDGTEVANGDSGGALLGYARRELAASSEDPAAFTTSEADEWVAVTLAIRPAADTGTPYGRTTETETARALVASKAAAFGRAVETTLARAFGLIRAYATGRATETETARGFTAAKSAAAGRATETETTRAFGVDLGAVIGRVTESETARSFTVAKAADFSRATEVEAARAFGVTFGHTFGRVTETEQARGFTAAKTVTFGRVVEVDAARGFTTGPVPESVVTAQGTHSLIVTAAGTYAPTVAAGGIHDLIVEAEGAL